jgi:hypothetical protein
VDSLGSNESALLEVTAVFCGIVVATGIALIVSSTALEALAHERSLISHSAVRSCATAHRFESLGSRASGHQLCHGALSLHSLLTAADQSSSTGLVPRNNRIRHCLDFRCVGTSGSLVSSPLPSYIRALLTLSNSQRWRLMRTP